MITKKLSFPCYFFFLVLLNTRSYSANLCTSSCGDIHNITFPFRLKSDPPDCGNKNYELSCEDNSTVLHLDQGIFIVKAINYTNQRIHLVDPGINKEDCSSLPGFPLLLSIFSSKAFLPSKEAESVKVIKCEEPVHSDMYKDANSCLLESPSGKFFRYAYVGTMYASDLKEGCNIEAMTVIQLPNISMTSFIEIHRQMAFGFELSYYRRVYYSGIGFYCYSEIGDRFKCHYHHGIAWVLRSFGFAVRDLCWYIAIFFDYEGSHFTIKEVLDRIKEDLVSSQPMFYWLFHALGSVVLLLAGRNLCGTPFVIAFFIYKWRRRHLSGYHTIEEFLQADTNLIMPIQYAYSDIKKMTGGFCEMLGKGGFGSVYKGKLRSGQYAAIKMLETSKGKGQDFINEVATIGRIHHANIVRLIGFCSRGSRHALLNVD